MAANHPIIAGNDAARERLRAVVGGLSDEDLARPLGDGWTVAAALAHLAFWDRRTLGLLAHWRQQRTGDLARLSPTDVDMLNDALCAEWLALPPREAALLALDAAAAVDRALATLPPAELDALASPEIPIRLDRAHHRNAHLDEIEQALR